MSEKPEKYEDVTLGTILEAIQGMEQRFNKRIDSVEQNQQELSKKVDAVSKQVAAMQEDIYTIKEDINEIKGTVSYLEAKTAKHDKKIYLIENPIKEA